MSTTLVVVREHDSLWSALDRFTGTGLRHLVVLDDRDGLVGVLDDRLTLAAWPLEAVGQKRRTIGQLLRQTASPAEPSPQVHPAAPIRQAGHLMLTRQVDALPVVDGAGAVMGIVTGSDLIRSLLPLAEPREAEDGAQSAVVDV